MDDNIDTTLRTAYLFAIDNLNDRSLLLRTLGMRNGVDEALHTFASVHPDVAKEVEAFRHMMRLAVPSFARRHGTYVHRRFVPHSDGSETDYWRLSLKMAYGLACLEAGVKPDYDAPEPSGLSYRIARWLRRSISSQHDPPDPSAAEPPGSVKMKRDIF